MKTQRTILLYFLVLNFFSLKSQLSGTYAVPANFSTIGAAITNINNYGVTGPVTINIAAGHTETATAGGYTLTNAIGSSSLNTITFQKSGLGSNPLIYAQSGGTAYTSSARPDGVLRLVGADNVTIDGIDITDNNPASYSLMEFGICLMKANSNDGCQNNIIKNCVITLNRGNYSRAIELSNASPNNHQLALTVAGRSGRHINNKISSNILQQCNIAVYMNGYNAGVLNSHLADSGNVVGGPLAIDGNAILNFGGIYSLSYGISLNGQYTSDIQNNIIDSDNGGGAPTTSTISAIYLVGTLANATIKSNTLSVKTTSYSEYSYCIKNVSSAVLPNSILSISNNLITGCAANSYSSHVFTGIYNSAPSSSLIISGNTFTNNSIYTATNSIALILNEGSSKLCDISNNKLGLNITTSFTGMLSMISSTNSISNSSLSVSGNNFYNAGFSGHGNLKYIYVAGVNSELLIQNNQWNAINCAVSKSVTLIENAMITGNSAIISDNQIVGGMTITSGNCNFFGYYGHNASVFPSVLTFSNNTLNNINCTTSGSGSFKGFVIHDGILAYPQKNILNNLVSNLTYLGTSNIIFSINGMGVNGSGQGSSIHSNTITNILAAGNTTLLSLATSGNTNNSHDVFLNSVNQSTFTGATSSIVSVYLNSAGPRLNFYRNKITDVHLTSNSQLTALAAGGSGYVNVFNNILANFSATASTYTSAVQAIVLSSTGEGRINHNSIYLSGSTFGSNAIFVNNYKKLEVRNNLVINKLSAATSGSISALYIGLAESGALLYANNNLYYTGVPAANNPLVRTATQNYFTISQAYNGLGGIEQNSVTEDVSFASLSSSAGNFLTVNSSSVTLVESGGALITDVIVDFYGNSRNIITPDIGAIEGAYLQSVGDFNAPVISNGGFVTQACNLSSRTYTAHINDMSGVASGTLSPRLYYKVNNGLYASTAGTLSSGTFTSGIWSFVMNYFSNPYDTVFYFLAAQDNATISNISTFPLAALAGSAVTSITNTPQALKFGIVYSLSGTYSVGATGTFTTLTQAAKAYNTACLNGPVTFILTNTLYTSGETFPISFGGNLQASSVNSLLIKPNAGTSVLIKNTVNDVSVIKFNKASFITLDGNSGAANTLSVANSYTYWLTPSAVIWLNSDTGEESGNKNITISNLEIRTDVPNSTVIGISASNLSNGYAYNNDYISILNNTITSVAVGISVQSYAPFAYYDNDHWLISNNLIGTITSSVNLMGTGINFGRNSGFTITSNTITNLFMTGSFNFPTGISIGSCQNTAPSLIKGNTIRTIKSDVSSAYGMVITSSNDIEISNNMISDIGLSGPMLGITYIYALRLNGADNIKLYNNTIALTQGTTYVSASYQMFTACLHIVVCSNLDMRNNLFYNNVYNSLNAGNSRSYGVYSQYSNNTISTSDYNNYYVPNGVIGYNNPTLLTTIWSMNLAYGGDLNSAVLPVVLTSSTDPHLDPTSLTNWNFQNLGTAIQGITTDIDNQIRHISSPDIGADEWDSVASCTAAIAGTINVPSISLCANDATSIMVTGASGGANSIFQWKVSNSPTGTFTNVSSGTGGNSLAYNTATLQPGVYYYKIDNTCPSLSLTASSNMATVTVVAPAITPTLSATHSSLCSGTTATLSVVGPTTYTWSNGATSSSIAVTPGGITNYYVNYRNAPCPVQSSNTITLYVAQTPTLGGFNTTICNGAIATLSAGGASTYTWSNGPTINMQTVSPTVTTTYTLEGTIGLCSSSKNFVVFVKPLPVITVAGPTVACANQNVSLVASGATTYTWNTGSISRTLVVTPTISTTYSVSGTLNGCLSSSSTVYSLTFNPQPTVVITANQTSLCSGQTISLTASGASSYTWSSGSNSNLININPTLTATYSLTGEVNGCENTTSIQLTVMARPVIAISNGTICEGASYTLQPSGATSYTFSSGSAIVSPTITQTYTVIGTGTNNCSSSAIAAVSVNPLPLIGVNSGSICSGQTFTFSPTGADTYSYNSSSTIYSSGIYTVSSPTVNATFSITGTSSLGCISSNTAISSISVVALPLVGINSGSICQGANFTLNPSGAATYSYSSSSAVVSPNSSSLYTVTGFAANGCSNTAVSSVFVHAAPAVAVNSGSICAGQVYTMLPSGAVSYTFSNGSNTVSPFTNTNYTVSGTGTNNCVSSTISTVVVNALPIVSVNSGSVCSGQSFTLTPSGTFSYVISGGTTVVTPTSTSIYSVSGISSNGCQSSNVATANVFVYPQTIITVNSGSICTGQSFIMTPSGAVGYSFQTGSATVTPNSSSIYTVVGIDVNNCQSPAVTSSVTVFLNPVMVVYGDSVICAGESTTITATGANNYSWSFGSSTSTVVVTPTVSTNYTVNGISTNSCASSFFGSIIVNPIPTLSINGSLTICQGASTTLSVSGNANTYLWSFGSTFPIINVSPTINTVYSVIVTDNQTCSAKDSVTVFVNPLPVLTVNVSDTTVCENSTLKLVASGAQVYNWTGGITNNTSFIVSGTKVYTVVGTDFNGCNAVRNSTVNMLTAPQLNVYTSSQTICEGEFATLNASGSPTLSWSTSDTTHVLVIQPTITQIYSVTATNSLGCVGSGQILIKVEDCTAIEKQQSNNEFIQVFPNPTEGAVFVKINDIDLQLHYELFSLTGSLVKSGELRQDLNSVDLNSFAKGFYILRVFSEPSTLMQIKIIKQ